MAQSRNEGNVRILRVHYQAADGMGIWKPDKFPGLTGVDGLIHTVSADDVPADASLSGTDIDDVGVGFGNGQRTNRRRCVLLLVKKSLPNEPAIGGLPSTPGHTAKIIR